MALLKLQKLSAKLKLLSNQTLLELFDRFNYELEDPAKPVKMSSLSEVYYQVLSHEALSKEVDSTLMEQRFKSGELKAKDLFNFVSVCRNRDFLERNLVPEAVRVLPSMIPEEIVILN